MQEVVFAEENEDDGTQDPTYEPSSADGGSTDVSQLTADSGAAPTDLQSEVSMALSATGKTVSEIYPHDSVSMRNMQQRRKRRTGAGSEISASPSVASFHSSDGHLYKTLFGRAFNNQSDQYMLPADDDEHSRLDMQHFAVCLHIDSLFPFKNLVRRALKTQSETGSPPAILDVGTGSGRWAVDMAVQYPDAEVIGVDLVPPALLSRSDIPKNCRFEVDDANLSLAHYANTFTLVHARSIDSGINDMDSFMYEAANTLKPGGVFIVGAGSPQLFDENMKPFRYVEPGEPGFTWSQWSFAHVYGAYLNRGNYGVNAPLHWKRWAQRNPNFTKVYVEDLYIPLGPWQENLTKEQTFVANLSREALARAAHAFKPLLLLDGHNAEDVDVWAEETVKELRECRCRGFLRWAFCAAVRGDQPWQERLEQPPENPELFNARVVVDMSIPSASDIGSDQTTLGLSSTQSEIPNDTEVGTTKPDA